MRDENDEIVRMVGTINNVDEVIKSEEALRYRAEFDPLTGLYNRQAFLNYAAYLLEKNPNVRYGVVVLDVNRFKFINDVYGYEEGNALLRYIAAVIRTSVRKETDGYCRMYGDEFAILAAYEDKDDLTALCGVITKRVAEYALGYQAAVSSGIYVVEDRSAPVSAMCDWAALAQKTVKGSTLQNWAFYDEALRLRQLEEPRKLFPKWKRRLPPASFSFICSQAPHARRQNCGRGSAGAVASPGKRDYFTRALCAFV